MVESTAVPGGDDPTATSKFTAVTGGQIDQQPVHGLDDDDRAAIAALPANSALLIVLRGANTGSRFLLNSESTMVGRSTRADIFLDDVTVSRKHAYFTREGENFFVRDAGSLNGTYVNRQLVEQAQLHDGDEVRIGKFRLTFCSSPNAQGSQGTA